MTYQTLKTPSGETLIVLTEEEFENLRDAADYAEARAALTPGEETLTMDEAMSLAEARTPLAFWRRKRGRRQQDLAAAAGISQSYLAGIESGDRKGTPDLIKRLAAELGLRMEDLVAE